MAKFTVGVSAALFGAAGKPCFDERILAEVRDHDEIEIGGVRAAKQAGALPDLPRESLNEYLAERPGGSPLVVHP